MTGIGVAIAALGVLFLLLGLAEHLRSIPKVALIWFTLGAVMAIVGSLIAAVAWSRGRRR